jgi:hypothetical protein
MNEGILQCHFDLTRLATISTAGVDVDPAADPSPVEIRFYRVTKNVAKLFSLRFAFNVIRLHLEQLCLNILGSF